MPAGLKIATIWLLLGGTVFVGIRWWQHEAQRTRFQAAGSAIEIRRSGDGHYHWPGEINGRAIDFLVDTGATGTAIPASLARELGLETIGQVQSNTAGGVVTSQVVRANLLLRGGVRVDRLAVTALPLGTSPLLGMDVLGKLRWSQRDAVLRVEAEPAR